MQISKYDPPTFQRNDLERNSSNSKEKELLQHSQNNQTAWTELLFLFLNPKEMDDFKGIYQQVFDLFPSITDKNFRIFIQRLPPFLECTAHLPKQQFHLAILLGDEFGKRKDFKNGILCLSQALKIAKQLKDGDKEKNSHIKMTQLLSQSIQDQFLPLELFKSKLERARRRGEIEVFRQGLAQIKNLNQLFFTSEKDKYIEGLYEQARDVLHDLGAPAEFNSFVTLINRERKTPIPPPKFCITEKYHLELHEIRTRFGHLSATQNVREFQNEITASFKSLFRSFIEQAFIILGYPPCHFDFRAIGSLGREEPSPFSDLEFFILIEGDKEAKSEKDCGMDEQIDYFKKLLQFFELQVLSLGETPGREFVFTCIGDRNASGFHIDDGGNPLLNPHLIGTPQSLALLQKLPMTKLDDAPTDPANQILKSQSLFSSTSDLFDDFTISFQYILNNPAGKKQRKLRGLQLLEKRVSDFAKTGNSNTLSTTINVKNQFIQFINFFLADLAYYFCFPTTITNSMDIIDELVAKSKFTYETGLIFKEAVTTLYRIRVHLHQFYGEQKEDAHLKGLQGYILKKSEFKDLQQIYFFILLPLYQVCLPKILKGNFTVEEVFNKLDILGVIIDDIRSSQSKPELFTTVIKLIASFPIYYKIKSNYYKQLSQRADLEPLRETFADEIKKEFSSEELKMILSCPNRAGVRLAYKQEEISFKEKIEGLTSFVPHQENILQVKIISSSGIRFLKPEAVLKILDHEGMIRNDYPGSAHRVSSFGGLHFKQKPTHPLMEYAIYNLYDRLFGGLNPPTELVRFEVSNKKMYPVLISKTINGKTLKERVREKFTASAPTWNRWCCFLLASILTRPGDGRSSNYILDDQDQLYCIDNDISFVEPLLKKLVSSQVNFCSALFCLFREKPIDRQVIEDFCSLDPDAILQGWIDDVIKKEAEYISLFSEEERIMLYEEDPNNRFKATILFKEGTLATLNTQFVFLQNKLHASLLNNVMPTPLDLLKFVITLNEQPHLIQAPGTHIHRFYSTASQNTLDDKLKWITSRMHDQSLQSLKSDMACLGQNPTHDQIEKKKLFSPEIAKEELALSLLKRSTHFLTIGRFQGKETIQANFKELRKDGKADIDRQLLVLRSLINLLNMEQSKPISVTLQYCEALDIQLLSPFLNPQLEYLDIMFCPKIKNGDLEVIGKKCPKLKLFNLSGCFGITTFQNQNGNIFSNLRQVYLDKCYHLTKVQLKCPALIMIHARKCPALSRVEIGSFLSPTNAFNECPKLFPESLKVVQLHQNSDPKSFDELIDDKEFMLSYVSQDGTFLKLASKTLQNDKDIVLIAVNQNGKALQFASEELKKDSEVVLSCSIGDGSFINFVSPDLLNNKDFILKAVSKHSRFFKYLSTEWRNDRAIVLKAVTKKGSILKFASRALRENRDFMLEVLCHNAKAFKFIDERFQTDLYFIISALGQNKRIFEFVNHKKEHALNIVMKNGNFLALIPLEYHDQEIALAAVAGTCEAYQFVDEKIKHTREFALEASILNPEVMESLPRQFLSENEFALAVVKRNGMALKYLPEFQNNREVVSEAVKQNPQAFSFAAENLSNDQALLEELIAQNPAVIKYASKRFTYTKEVLLKALAKTEDEQLLELIPHESKNDKSFILSAVRVCGKSLKFASESLKQDEDVVFEAINNDPSALLYACSPMRNNKDFILRAMDRNQSCFKYAGENLKSRKNDVLEIVKKYGHAFSNISLDLQNDRQVILAAVTQWPLALQEVDSTRQNDKEFIKSVLTCNGFALKYVKESFKSDKEIVFIAVAQNGLSLEFASTELRNDHEVVLAAVKQNGHALKFASQKFWDDKVLTTEAVKANTYSINYVSQHLKTDKDFLLSLIIDSPNVLEIIEENYLDHNFIHSILIAKPQAFQYVPKKFVTNKDQIRAFVESCPEIFPFIPPEFKNDDSFILSVLEKNVWLLKHLYPKHRSNKQIVLKCVKINGLALDFASDELKSDRAVVLTSVKEGERPLWLVNERFWSDKEIVLSAVIQNPWSIEYASPGLKNDKEIVSSAVKRCGWTLQFASETLRNDSDIVLAAMNQSIEVLEYASKQLKKNKEFLTQAAKKNLNALLYAEQEVLSSINLENETGKEAIALFHDNKALLLKLVSINGLALKFANNRLKQDEEIVIAAVTQNGLALEFANENIRSDNKIVGIAVKQNGLSLKYANEELRSIPKIVYRAIEQNGLAYQYASSTLQRKRKIALSALKHSLDTFNFIPVEMKQDKSFLIDAVKQNIEVLKCLNADLLNDSKFMEPAILHNLGAFHYLGENLKNNRQFILGILKRNGLALQFVSVPLCREPAIMCAAIKQNGLAIQFASKKGKRDLDLIKTALNQCKEAFKVLDEDLKSDINFLLLLIKEMGIEILEQIDFQQKNNEKFMEALFKKGQLDASTFKYASDRLRGNRPFILSILGLQKEAKILNFIPEKLKDDQHFMLEAIKCCLDAFNFASDQLKNNKIFILEAVKLHGNILKFLTKYDTDIVLAAVQQNGLALEFACKELREDKQIVLAAVEQNGLALEFASDNLKSDEEVTEVAIEQNPAAKKYVLTVTGGYFWGLFGK